MNSDSNKDRRSATRFPITAKCWLEQEALTLLGTVTNISHTGLYMRTPVLVEKGSDVNLSLTFGDTVVSAKGQVVWTAPSPCEPRSLGVGIGFYDTIDVKEVLDTTEDSEDNERP